MNAINICPICASWLNYDGDSKEWFCNSCNYSEFEKFKFKLKVRKEEISE